MATAQDIKDALADQKAINERQTAAIAANVAATTGLSTVISTLVTKIQELRASGGATPEELDGILADVQTNADAALANVNAVEADTAAEGAAATAGAAGAQD